MKNASRDPTSSLYPSEEDKVITKFQRSVLIFFDLFGAFILFVLLSTLPFMLMDSQLNMSTTIAPIAAVISLLVYLAIWKRKKHPFDFKAISLPNRTWLCIAGLVPGITVLHLLLSFLIEMIIEIPADNISPLAEYIPSQSPWVLVLRLVIMAPIMEEIYFRGILLNRLRTITSSYRALIISSLIFGLMHGSILSSLSASITGLILGVIYVKTNDLRAPMIYHAANNGFLLIMSSGLEVFTNNSSNESDIFFSIIFCLLPISFLALAIYCFKQLQQIIKNSQTLL